MKSNKNDKKSNAKIKLSFMKILTVVLVSVITVASLGAQVSEHPCDTCALSYYNTLVKEGIVIPDTWVDEAVKVGGWKPRYPELFNDLKIKKVDSLVNLCETLIPVYYGPCDSLIRKCKVNTIEGKELPEEFDILYIVGRKLEVIKEGYNVNICDNPLRKIEWYRNHRGNISPKIYMYMDFLSELFSGGNLARSDVDLGLKYNDWDNRRYAVTTKSWDLRGEIDVMIDHGASDEEFLAGVKRVLYEEPFYDFEADLYDE